MYFFFLRETITYQVSQVSSERTLYFLLAKKDKTCKVDHVNANLFYTLKGGTGGNGLQGTKGRRQIIIINTLLSGGIERSSARGERTKT